jgi:predicted nucleic acid-binding Zn ribbon protein
MSKDGYYSRKKEVAPLESAFNDLLKAYRLEGKFREKSLVHDWPDLVGKTIADRTTSVFIKDKKLFVKLSSGPIKKELLMNKSKLLTMIGEKYGAGVIDDLVCM